jgi:predicted NBD/HSP70 family sugar kinase
MPRATPELPKPPTPRTLCIDIGGTGVKALVLDAAGEPLTDRVRVETPRPATPRRVVQAIWALVEPLGPFERVSAGFPGVVVDRVTGRRPTSTGLPPTRWRGGCRIAPSTDPGPQ